MVTRVLAAGLVVGVLGLAGCARMRDLEKQNTALRGDLEALQSDYSDLEAENRALKADRETLQADLAGAQKESDRVADLVAALQAERDKLQRQATELKAILDDFGDFTVEARGEGNFIVMPSEILFEPGKTELSATAQASLDQVAAYLAAHPEMPVRVDGHTDGVPITYSGWQDNYHLSVMRAHAVMRYLVGGGVAPARIHIVGFGPNKPRVQPGQPEQDMPENRRVEIMLVPSGARSIPEILEGFKL